MKKMTPKERVMAFFHNEPAEGMPTDEGLFVMTYPSAFHERPPFLKTGKDWFGVDWKYEESVNAVVPDHTKKPVMEDINDWREAVEFPDLDAWDWSKVDEIDHVSEIDRENQVFEMMFLNGPFERLHFLMGFENALCAMITDPEECAGFLEAFMDWKLALMEKVITYYRPDVLMFHDDWGTQSSLFFSPELWRTLIKPQIKRAVDRCHELGCIFELHSCGKMEAIVPEFVEMGIDSWQGMEINDIAALKKVTGKKLGYHTTPEYQKYQAQEYAKVLDEDAVRREVREKFYRLAEGGCYFPRLSPFGGRGTQITKEVIAECAKTLL